MKTIGFLALTLLLGGCGIFSRAKSTFYSLDTIPSERRAAAVGGVPVGIDGIELPPGLDRRELVVRGADQKLEIRGTHQWAAPLEDMVLHTLAFDLANRLPEGMIVLPGQPKPGAARSLAVVFEDLATGSDGVFVLDARWTLDGVTRHERITLNVPSAESAEIASAMSRALATLADRIAATLTGVASS
jgi:uncharacterized lipoprotein YmbA